MWLLAWLLCSLSFFQSVCLSLYLALSIHSPLSLFFVSLWLSPTFSVSVSPILFLFSLTLFLFIHFCLSPSVYLLSLFLFLSLINLFTFSFCIYLSIAVLIIYLPIHLPSIYISVIPSTHLSFSFHLSIFIPLPSHFVSNSPFLLLFLSISLPLSLSLSLSVSLSVLSSHMAKFLGLNRAVAGPSVSRAHASEWECACRNQRQTPFVSIESFARDAAMTAAAQLTERGPEEGGSEGSEERLKYLAYLTCRPRRSGATVEKEGCFSCGVLGKDSDKASSGIYTKCWARKEQENHKSRRARSGSEWESLWEHSEATLQRFNHVLNSPSFVVFATFYFF